MPGTAVSPLRPLLLLHAACLAYFCCWGLFAASQARPFSILTIDPVSAVEAALLDVQQHPGEGIHALARIQLPPYTGVLHLSSALLWGIAAAFALQRRATWAVALLPLLLLQESVFITSERLGFGLGLNFVYLAALGTTLREMARPAIPGRPEHLACLVLWLLARFSVDLFGLPTALTQGLEVYCGVQAALLYAALAQRHAP